MYVLAAPACLFVGIVTAGSGLNTPFRLLLRRNMGFEVIHEFITPDEEATLFEMCKKVCDAANDNLDGDPYDNGRDKVVRYGYAYGGVGKRSPIPEWITLFCNRLRERGYDHPFNAITVNRYLPGQGIAHHVDSTVFDDAIIVLSVGSSCTFEFCNLMTGEKIHRFLHPRDLSVMTGEERYIWTHSVLPLTEDVSPLGEVVPRGVRYSIVFRTHTM